LEGTPEAIAPEALSKALENEVAGVRGVHHVHLWSLSSQRLLLTLHATIDPDIDQTQVLSGIQHLLKSRFDIDHATVQLETSPEACHGAGCDGMNSASVKCGS
jgi:cobalt-zinc-cadmium efflux system protein